MFKKFSFKIRINVICIVCIMLLIQFVLTYILFFSIFTEDFKQKADELSSQISNHVTLRLQHVEEAARLFCNENDIQNSLETFDSTLLNKMSSLLAVTSDIRGCFIVGKERSYFYSSAYNRKFMQFFDYIAPQFDHTGKRGYWCIYSPPVANGKSYLIYSYVIRDDNQVPVGVLSVDVSLENLYTATEMFDTDLMKYTTVYISSEPSGEKIFFRDENNASALSGAESHHSKYHYSDSISMNTVSSVEYIQTKLRFVVFIMITIFAGALLLLFIILYAYSRYLIKRMTDLTYKMNNFIDRE